MRLKNLRKYCEPSEKMTIRLLNQSKNSEEIDRCFLTFTRTNLFSSLKSVGSPSTHITDGRHRIEFVGSPLKYIQKLRSIRTLDLHKIIGSLDSLNGRRESLNLSVQSFLSFSIDSEVGSSTKSLPTQSRRAGHWKAFWRQVQSYMIAVQ
jgi:hypothetical protein